MSIINPIYGFDRVRLHTDAVIPTNKLFGFKVIADRTPYDRHRRSLIEVLQPDAERLEALEFALKHHQIDVSYAELAVDVPSLGAIAQHLLAIGLGCLHFSHLRAPVRRFRTTCYVGCKSQGISAAMYADKPSKLGGKSHHLQTNAFHLEYRISGAEALARAGISSFRDVLDFDHRQFHDRRTRVLDMPKSGELGRLLANRSPGVSFSPAALRKRARVWTAVHCVDGHFCLHSALRATPGLSRKLASRMTFSEWIALRKTLERCY